MEFYVRATIFRAFGILVVGETVTIALQTIPCT
jgi:hypothetical protein